MIFCRKCMYSYAVLISKLFSTFNLFFDRQIYILVYSLLRSSTPERIKQLKRHKSTPPPPPPPPSICLQMKNILGINVANSHKRSQIICWREIGGGGGGVAKSCDGEKSLVLKKSFNALLSQKRGLFHFWPYRGFNLFFYIQRYGNVRYGSLLTDGFKKANEEYVVFLQVRLEIFDAFNIVQE